MGAAENYEVEVPDRRTGTIGTVVRSLPLPTAFVSARGMRLTWPSRKNWPALRLECSDGKGVLGATVDLRFKSSFSSLRRQRPARTMKARR